MKASVTFTFTGLFIAVAAFYFYQGNPFPSAKTETPAAPEKGSDKLLDLDKEAITMIQIQKPGDKETVTIERSGTDWMLKYPVNYLADNMMIEGLNAALRVSQKARRLVREKGWDEYGLLQPRLKIGVQAKGLNKRKYLLLGDDSPVAAMIFARWEDEPEYFLLDARFLESFDRTLYSLREKRLIRLPLNDLQKIHIRTFKDNFELAQQEGQWYWTEPVARIGKKVPREVVYEILMSMRELYVKEFLDGQPVKETERGLTVSGAYVQAWDAKKTALVRIGNEISEHDAYYGLIEGEKVALEVARGNIQKFFNLVEATIEEPAPAASKAPVKAAPQAPAEEKKSLDNALAGL